MHVWFPVKKSLFRIAGISYFNTTVTSLILVFTIYLIFYAITLCCIMFIRYDNVTLIPLVLQLGSKSRLRVTLSHLYVYILILQLSNHSPFIKHMMFYYLSHLLCWIRHRENQNTILKHRPLVSPPATVQLTAYTDKCWAFKRLSIQCWGFIGGRKSWADDQFYYPHLYRS